ncbi:hypothetical protein NA8A_16883 [Nitratireductor indicus C115]|uniref:DUF2946 domain-containing protein n=1 Tax=Nitratireductor indicus C115 TaxID=1231190 RepID=K2N119_9HYPH|nr:hypothetical protein [Nitratireductor indicus]EKF41188.1 hypothetical protein NA8A_16883 [Nitratireductor indicus C115]SFQ64590.1 hypothetical protein SAMN05216176_108151 [Nitratireductor indicus]
MRKGEVRTSWFESLRRDAGLFAAVGFLALFLNALQPLLAAAATATPGGFVICTTYGVGTTGDNNREHPRNIECPLCLTGHSCSFQIVASAPASPAAIGLPSPVAVPAEPHWALHVPAARTNDPPPSIRAPPLPV